MSKIEEKLYTYGNNLQNITVPENLDERLEKLKFPEKPSLFNMKKICVACVTAIVLISVFTVTAVGVKNSGFSGFDTVISDSVAEAINRENIYQPKNLSHTFSDGTCVTVDGLAVDVDEMSVFGTVSREADIDFSLLDRNGNLLLTGGDGVIDFSENRYRMTYDDIKSSKLKKCRLQVTYNGEVQIFELSPDVSNVKKSVYKLKTEIEHEGTVLELESMQFNVMSTTLHYKIRFPKELADDSGWFDNYPEIYIEADGKKVDELSGGMSSYTSLFKPWTYLQKFQFSGTLKSDPIPQGTEKVTVVIKSIPVLKTNANVTLKAESGAYAESSGAKFKVLELEYKDGKTSISIEGNCLFYKDFVTAEKNGVKVAGERVNWKKAEESYGYIHYYEFDGEIDSITIDKFVCNEDINKTVELK